jgi:hypothetical protein
MLLFLRPDGYKLITFLGRSNIGEKTPDNLDFIAEEGSGVYENTKNVFGPRAADVMKGVSLETMNLGLMYFDTLRYSRDRLEAVLALLDVPNTKHYTAYSLRSNDLDQGFVTQTRFVSDLAMEYYFRVNGEGESEREQGEQAADIHEAFVSFVESEIQDFGSEGRLCKHLGIEVPFDGSFGLGFGFMIENSYWRIYRIWSRPVYYSK